MRAYEVFFEATGEVIGQAVQWPDGSGSYRHITGPPQPHWETWPNWTQFQIWVSQTLQATLRESNPVTFPAPSEKP